MAKKSSTESNTSISTKSGTAKVVAHTADFRPAAVEDLAALEALENTVFETDRLSRRSLRSWIISDHGIFLVCTVDGLIAGYLLIIVQRGTSLARLYSIAIADQYRGRGLARELVRRGENAACDASCIYLRLEVRRDNTSAMHLYESLGYHRFGEYHDYYEDHADALRYQKRIRHFDTRPLQLRVPWYRQTTSFTCGPAALMMAMEAINDDYLPTRSEELDIWREATTIFMTSGHGGCHPLGLALAAEWRGYEAEVWISQREPLFVDSVRSTKKKRIIALVHDDFAEKSVKAGIKVHYQDITQDILTDALSQNAVPIVLVSTWQTEGKKAPHWVVVSAFDEHFLYVHDPDAEDGVHNDLDCQHVPIARADFDRMSRFGQQRLRTAVIVRKRTRKRSVKLTGNKTATSKT